MDKQTFFHLLKKNGPSSPDEATAILLLRSEFPYSQIMHVLAAKASKEHRLDSHQKDLTLAAVSCADRHVLKEVISAVGSAQNAEPPATTTPTASLLVADDFIPGDMADRIMRDLKKLHASKHNFEMLFADSAAVSVAAGEEKRTGRQKRRRKDNPPEGIIDEIQTKEELEPESERQKEQLQIIDHFIKTQPSIKNPRDQVPMPVTDLNSIRAGEFGENIISETLVEILVKQGKKDRAIEVLKKLIWKYPQKKAYFASQIEDLKK